MEMNVGIAGAKKVACAFPVRVVDTQGKKRAECMFGVGRVLHQSWLY